MISKKNEQLLQFISLINNVFKNSNLILRDWWDGANSIGFQMDSKLVYVAFYAEDDYFYECSILDNESEQSYKIQNSNNATQDQLLRVIKKFFYQ